MSADAPAPSLAVTPEQTRYRWIEDEDAPKGRRRVKVIEFNGVEGYEVRFTEACSGCFEFGDYGGLAHNYPWDEKAQCRVGAGCDECGYTGKRRQIHFIPFTEYMR